MEEILLRKILEYSEKLKNSNYKCGETACKLESLLELHHEIYKRESA